MVTLEDVAVLAGVSRATVSRVVNGDTNVKALHVKRLSRLSPFSVIPAPCRTGTGIQPK